MESITIGGLTFRWTNDSLIVTTTKGHSILNASETARLLDMLYTQKDAIFDAEAHTDGLAAWACQHPVHSLSSVASTHNLSQKHHRHHFCLKKAAHVGEEMRVQIVKHQEVL